MVAYNVEVREVISGESNLRNSEHMYAQKKSIRFYYHDSKNEKAVCISSTHTLSHTLFLCTRS